MVKSPKWKIWAATQTCQFSSCSFHWCALWPVIKSATIYGELWISNDLRSIYKTRNQMHDVIRWPKTCFLSSFFRKNEIITAKYRCRSSVWCFYRFGYKFGSCCTRTMKTNLFSSKTILVLILNLFQKWITLVKTGFRSKWVH